MALWECCNNEQVEDSIHASLRYDEVESSGPASQPLEFPTPTVFRCEKVDIRARDHRSGTIHDLRHVILRTEPDEFGRPANAAYLVKKKICKSVYGTVRLCIVLKRINRDQDDHQADESREDSFSNDDESNDVEWESTDLQAVIKASSWNKIADLRGQHLEDPIKEVAAMQHLGNYEPNVLGALEVLQDDDFLYTIMDNVPGGDLYGRIMGEAAPGSPLDSAPAGVSESQAREWFQQMLRALFHLQKKGVCHRDISLENILLNENDQIVLIDPGMSLRVPYTDPCNFGYVTDVSAGTCRRLIKAQGQGGKLMYAAPEVLQRDEAYDGFAVDLFAAGVILFISLVGLAPFKWAHPSDNRYSAIEKGELRDTVASLDIPLSEEACDLLQGMFWRDPRKRFTLAEIMEHPWVLGKTSKKVTTTPPVTPKRGSKTLKSRRKTTSKIQQTCEKTRSRFRPNLSQVDTVDSRI